MEELLKMKLITFSLMDVGASSSSCSQNLTAQTKSIEDSKVHWSVLSECDSELSDDQIIANNTEVFKSLQSHPEYGEIFRTVDKFYMVVEDKVAMVVQDKFAEGAQAEIFNMFATWPNMAQREMVYKWALKVFKKGTLLEQLQSQWPCGYLQWKGRLMKRGLALIKFRSFVADVSIGFLLPTGEFAFLMEKEEGDLRKLIVSKRPHCGYACGPFEKQTMEHFLYQIASGMDWLHKHNIIHRDLKASNVLVTKNTCYVADFECSIGVIGTGFWRDSQILQACKERNASQHPELFARSADVYSYGMTCYEILTGKLPFEEELMTIDLVIEGRRPTMPEFIDQWIKDLLCKCWETNREARPTFEDILNIIVANTTSDWIKSRYKWHLKVNNEEINPLLGCNNLLHDLELMDCLPHASGVYKCKLCLKQGHGGVYHCSSCSDFDLHPKCATISTWKKSFLHPHVMYLQPSFRQNGRGITCDACQLEILEGYYHNSYKCLEDECDFDLHTHCAKYAQIVSHPLHEEHELALVYSSTFVGVGDSTQVCNNCNIELDPLEIVYSCRECGFNIHPHCIVAKFECKSW